MTRKNHRPDRRTFLRLGSAIGIGAVSVPHAVSAGDESADEEIDDRGNPIDPDEEKGMEFGILSTLPVNPDDFPDGSIESSFNWLDNGSAISGTDAALRLEDDGGVEPEFRPSTNGDLTIVFDWRHDDGGSLAYAFNDFDSTWSGFRAFTNGIAGNGFYFRNVFGGNDVEYDGDLQDGDWHRIRVALNAADNEYQAYIDGDLVGKSFYDGDGWTARDEFRVMGRPSGSSTTIDYDRYRLIPDAVGPDGTSSDDPLIQYDIEEGSGNVLTNSAAKPEHDRIEEKEALIKEVRTSAGTVLPKSVAGGLDEEAEDLLADLENELEDSSDSKVIEGLDRMLLSEEVTSAGTDAGISPAAETGDACGQLAMIIVTAGAGKTLLTGGGRTARILSNRLEGIRSSARSVFDDLAGWSRLDPTIRREINDEFDRARSEVREIIDDYRSELENAGEVGAATTLEAILDELPGDVLDRLASVRESFESFMTGVFYNSYQTQAEEVNDDGDREQPPGIDTAIDQRMTELREFIDDRSLPGSGRDGRVKTRDDAIDDLDDTSNSATNILDATNDIVDGLDLAGTIVALVALLAYAISIVLGGTGVGIVGAAKVAAIGGKLTLISGGLTALAVTLAGGGALYGRRSLNAMADRHDRATATIVSDSI